MIVQNIGKFIRHIGDVALVPGANQLNEDQSKAFETAMAQPLNKLLLNKEITLPQVKGKAVESIAEMKADDALLLIVDTFDLALLGKWIEEESTDKNRKSVVKALEQQIEDLKNPPEDTVVKTED